MTKKKKMNKKARQVRAYFKRATGRSMPLPLSKYFVKFSWCPTWCLQESEKYGLEKVVFKNLISAVPYEDGTYWQWTKDFNDLLKGDV